MSSPLSVAEQTLDLARRMARSGVVPAPGQTLNEAVALLAAARNAAYAEAARGRLGSGVSMLLRALNSQPMSHELQADMAALLLSAGEYAHAVRYARDALSLRPQHGPSLYALGFALSGLGEAAEAATVLRRASRGKARQSLEAEAPELLPLIRAELARIQRLTRQRTTRALRRCGTGPCQMISDNARASIPISVRGAHRFRRQPPLRRMRCMAATSRLRRSDA
jgi:tetratricopeptide (TPR) repeat protein